MASSRASLAPTDLASFICLGSDIESVGARLAREDVRPTNTFPKAKENPRPVQRTNRGFQISAVKRLPAQLIGKLRNPARQSRKPLALVPDRQELPGPNRHRGCRRWKQRSACRC